MSLWLPEFVLAWWHTWILIGLVDPPLIRRFTDISGWLSVKIQIGMQQHRPTQLPEMCVCPFKTLSSRSLTSKKKKKVGFKKVHCCGEPISPLHCVMVELLQVSEFTSFSFKLLLWNPCFVSYEIFGFGDLDKVSSCWAFVTWHHWRASPELNSGPLGKMYFSWDWISLKSSVRGGGQTMSENGCMSWYEALPWTGDLSALLYDSWVWFQQIPTALRARRSGYWKWMGGWPLG